jgi:hypothetical protein
LQALAAVAIAVAEGRTNDPEAAARLPSLATLARYRGRVERDFRLAERGFEAARRARPPLRAGGCRREMCGNGLSGSSPAR